MSAATKKAGAISPQCGSMPPKPTSATATGTARVTAAAVRIRRFVRFVMQGSVRHT